MRTVHFANGEDNTIMGGNVTADIYWAQVPEWVIDTATPRALQVYCILCRHADKTTRDTILLRSTIARRAKCSRKTVDRAMEELDRIGAVTVTHRFDEHGDPAPNNYRVHFIPRGVATQTSLPLDTDVPTGSDTDDQRGRDIDVAQNQSHLEPQSLKPKRRDLLWECFVEIHGTPADSDERGKFNRYVAKLRNAGVTDTEYPLLVAAYTSKHNGLQPAVATVANRIGELRNYVAKGPIEAPSPEELAEKRLWREAQAAYDAETETKGALP